MKVIDHQFGLCELRAVGHGRISGGPNAGKSTLTGFWAHLGKGHQDRYCDLKVLVHRNLDVHTLLFQKTLHSGVPVNGDVAQGLVASFGPETRATPDFTPFRMVLEAWAQREQEEFEALERDRQEMVAALMRVNVKRYQSGERSEALLDWLCQHQPPALAHLRSRILAELSDLRPINHCFECKSGIYKADPVCKSCNWRVCSRCRACGCEYTGQS